MNLHLFDKAIRMIETAQPIHAPAVRRWLDLLYQHLQSESWVLIDHDMHEIEQMFAKKFNQPKGLAP